MDGKAVIVVDTNVLLNFALPVVDGRSKAPSGEDPLKTLLTVYDVHAPSSVIGEVGDAIGGDDLLAAAAALVLETSDHLTTHDVTSEIDEPLAYGLDRGESHGIWLTNELPAKMFVTDEFNTTNYLFVALALTDRNTLFTTPHVLCVFADQNILNPQYVDAALTYFIETKNWDRQYVDQLRERYVVY